MTYDGDVLFSQEISNLEILPWEKQLELFPKAQNGDIEARQNLIESNLRIARDIATKFYTRYKFNLHNSSLGDVIDEAYFGLDKAISSFDVESGNRFTTYAYSKIPFHLKRYYEENRFVSQTVESPVYFQDLHRALDSFQTNFYKESGEFPDEETSIRYLLEERPGYLKKLENLDENKAGEVLKNLFLFKRGHLENPVFLDQTIEDDFDESGNSRRTLGEVMLGQSIDSDIEYGDFIEEFLKSFNDLEYGEECKEIYLKRFKDEETNKAIGERCGITGERIRQKLLKIAPNIQKLFAEQHPELLEEYFSY